MIPLNYHHLYYFWTVGRLGSISAAGHELYLSQSTLSSQLKELERSLNAKLLTRSRSGVTMTAEGRAVFDRCARIFAEGAELAAFVKSGYKAESVLRVGVRPTVTREVVLRVLRFVQLKDKECRVALFSGEAEVLVNKLRQQALDVVIGNQDFSVVSAKELRGRLVSQLPVYFVANRRLRRAVKRFPADLAKIPLLLRPADTSVRRQLDQYLRRKRIAYTVAADSDDVDLLRRLAIEGRGVAVLSAMSIASDLKSGRLATLHSSPVDIHEPVWFICHAQPRADPGLRRVLDGLMSEFMASGRAPKVLSRLDVQA